METRCVSFRSARSRLSREGKNEASISGSDTRHDTTRHAHDTRCALEKIVLRVEKRGENVPPASFGALLFVDFSAPFKVARTKFIGCCCSCRFKDDSDWSAIPLWDRFQSG